MLLAFILPFAFAFAAKHALLVFASSSKHGVSFDPKTSPHAVVVNPACDGTCSLNSPFLSPAAIPATISVTCCS